MNGFGFGGWLGGVAALALAACTSPEPAPSGPTLLMRSAPDLTFVIPLNVTTPLPDSVADGAPEVFGALNDFLRAHGTRVETLPFGEARRLWLESAREVQAQGGEGFGDAARVLAGKLVGRGEAGWIVVPSLFVQGATVQGRRVVWDGVEHPLPLDEGSWAGHFGEEEGERSGGTLPAASLHVVVLDPSGAILHQRQGGLALLSGVRLTGRPELGRPGVESAPIEDPFGDRRATLAGIAEAFRPLLAPLPPERLESRRASPRGGVVRLRVPQRRHDLEP